MAEQRTLNPQVLGSNPRGRTTRKWLLSRPLLADQPRGGGVANLRFATPGAIHSPIHRPDTPETGRVGPARVLACPDEPACVRLDHLRLEGPTEPTRSGRARKGAGSIRQIRPGVWKLSVTAPPDAGGNARRVHRTIRARSAGEAMEELVSFTRRGPGFRWSQRRGQVPLLRRGRRTLSDRAPARREGARGQDDQGLPGAAPQVVLPLGRPSPGPRHRRGSHRPNVRRDAPRRTQPVPHEPGEEPVHAVLPMGPPTGVDPPEPDGRVPTPDEQLRLMRAYSPRD